MKKKIFALAAVLFLAVSTQVKAQSFEQGTVTISAGYGFGNFGKAVFKALETEVGYSFSSIGPAFVKGEYGISDNIGLGVNIAYFGMNPSFEYIGSDGKTYEAGVSLRSYSVLARMNVHFANSDIVDPYFGVGVGYRGGRWKYEDSDPMQSYDWGLLKTSVFPFGFETTLGLRVYPISNLGIYAEVGGAKALAQVGLVGKF